MRPLRALPLRLVLAALAVLPACHRAESPFAGGKPENVLLIVVDTLRADHLSLYGYARPTSPNLDRLAKDGTVFEQARSQAACTCPSVNSILTSRYPARFIDQGFGNFSIPDDVPTIASMLKARGYVTFAASASSLVRATPSKMNRFGGFGAGFDRFDERCENKPAVCLNARLKEFLDARPKRFFAYLHYLDPHAPYAPPASYVRQFATGADAVAIWVRLGDPDPIERALAEHKPPGVTPVELRRLIALYDDEIAYLDGQLGALFADLEARGLLRSTLVVLAADHGEMFLEHGDVKHCRKQFDTVIRTPLVLWVPGVRGGRRVARVVENVDVVPTILDYLGVASSGLAGRSLRPEVDGNEPAGPALAFSMQTNLRSVTDGRYKLIYDLGTASAQLFDLQADAGEQTDVAARVPAERDRLEHALGAWLAAEEGPGTARRNVALGKQVEESLRALGYLQ